MPINETTIIVTLAILMLALLFYLGFAIYSLLETIFHRLQTKKLCRALEHIIVSYSETGNFDNAIAELEVIMQSIVKPDKKFPSTCRSTAGLLKQYIYWLNTSTITNFTLNSSVTELKNTSHKLIEHCRTSPFLFESQSYTEPLLNTISQFVDQKDWENTQKSIAELDTKIAKERKNANFIRNGVPPIATILGAVISAVLTALISA